MIQWLEFTPERRKELLGLASAKTGLTALAIEKDWWVTLTLYAVFQTEWAGNLVFKGGTSLSKSWGLIERFSEDIDLVLDRSVIGFGEHLSKNQIKELRKASCAFTSGPFREAVMQKFLQLGVQKDAFTLIVKETTESDRDPQVLILNYDSILEKGDYLKEAVLIEVGARSLREPAEQREINSIISQTLNNNVAGMPFSILTVTPVRTFLEKIFLLHEEFSKPEDKIKNERMSRHLYDIEKIMNTEYGKHALEDQELYDSIIEHRAKFNAVRGLNYANHHPHRVNFLPPGTVLKNWEDDYKAMQANMIYGESLSFIKLMEQLQKLQSRFRAINKKD